MTSLFFCLQSCDLLIADGELELDQPTEIKGVVLDGFTKKPIPDLRVKVEVKTYDAPLFKQSSNESHQVFTDQNGEFQLNFLASSEHPSKIFIDDIHSCYPFDQASCWMKKEVDNGGSHIVNFDNVVLVTYFNLVLNRDSVSSDSESIEVHVNDPVFGELPEFRLGYKATERVYNRFYVYTTDSLEINWIVYRNGSPTKFSKKLPIDPEGFRFDINW